MNTVTSNDGTTIAYDLLGDGDRPPLILIGGAIQHRAIDPQTAQLAALLAADRRVVHYDRRGRGDSGDTQPYATDRELDDVAALVTELGGRAALFGNSSGAMVALDTAARLGAGAVPAVAVYEAPLIVDDSRPPAPSDYLHQLRTLPRGEAAEYFLRHAALVPDEMIEGMRQSPFWPVMESIAPTLAYDGAFMAGLDHGRPLVTDRWDAVTVPVRVMAGGGSDSWLPAAGRALAGLLASATYEELPGQTHEVDPAVLAPAIDRFLRA